MQWIVVQKQPPEVFCKKVVLRNFVKCKGKHMCQSLLFNKVAGLRSATLLKKRLWQKCFPLNFAKFLGTPFLQNTSWRLLLVVYRTQYNSLKCTRSSCENCSYNSKNVLFNSNWFDLSTIFYNFLLFCYKKAVKFAKLWRKLSD